MNTKIFDTAVLSKFNFINTLIKINIVDFHNYRVGHKFWTISKIVYFKQMQSINETWMKAITNETKNKFKLFIFYVMF